MLSSVRRHSAVSAFLAISYVIVLLVGISDGRGWRGVAYLSASILSCLAVRAITRQSDLPHIADPRKQSLMLFVIFATGIAFFLAFNMDRFGGPHLQGLRRLALFVGVVIFLFPVASTVYLWRQGAVSLASQGLRPRGLLAAPAIVAIFVAAAMVVTPLRELASYVSIGLLASLFLQVLAEELVRFQLATRVGAWLQSPLTGVVIASLVWGLMHLPQYYRGALIPAVVGPLELLPLGVTFGYTSLRTGNIWPSVVAHLLNVWGLQAV